MSILLNCHQISKSYSSTPLFSGVTLSVFERERLGIIGANGSGKSTLLKIMADKETPDEGKVVRQKLLKTAYVGQTDHFDPEADIYTAVSRFVADAGFVGSPVDSETAVRSALSKIGLDDLDVKIGSLSGGWRKRVAIAGGFALEPDVLLLDEPTNHLDFEGIAWLERVLRKPPFAWVIVSHDRMFLENSCSKIIEISSTYPDGVLLCEGRYSDFLQKKTEYLEQQTAYAQSLGNKVRREIEWLRRGPKARTTKSKSRIDAAEKMQTELSDVKSRLKQDRQEIDFSGSGRRTKRLIELDQVGMNLGGKQLISDLSLNLGQKARLGLLGTNGSGKSTLLKIMTKSLVPTSGTVTHAQNLKVVYFDQKRSEIEPELALGRFFADTGDSVVYQGRSVHKVSYAKKFAFAPHQLDTPVGKLSGGEQARAIIGRLMLQEADVLLLDEPTNDLDIPTLEVLEESLMEFPGVVVLVTHDRYLLERVCNRFVGLDGQGQSRTYADYQQWAKDLQQSLKKDKSSHSAAKRTKGSSSKKLSYKEQRELDQMESAIEAAERELNAAEDEAKKPEHATNAAKLIELTTKLEKAQTKVGQLYERWAELEAKTDA